MMNQEPEESAGKDYVTMRAQFALLGMGLTRCHRAHDGRITYVVTRNTHSCYCTHLRDLQAHYTAVVAARLAATQAKSAEAVQEEKFDGYRPD